jgi:hypothetical protein
MGIPRDFNPDYAWSQRTGLTLAISRETNEFTCPTIRISASDLTARTRSVLANLSRTDVKRVLIPGIGKKSTFSDGEDRSAMVVREVLEKFLKLKQSLTKLTDDFIRVDSDPDDGGASGL